MQREHTQAALMLLPETPMIQRSDQTGTTNQGYASAQPVCEMSHARRGGPFRIPEQLTERNTAAMLPLSMGGSH